MKQLSIFSWVMVMILAACQSSSTTDVKEINDEDIARTVEATHIAEIKIEGMTCEMGCGGDIRKALRNTGGVSKVDFDFKSDREVNSAFVHFDAQTINLESIKRVISELNKGQFTVGEMDSRALSANESNVESSTSSNSESGLKMNNSMISLTDLAGIVAAWFL